MPSRSHREGAAAGDGMLHGLHGQSCASGNEYSTARPVVLDGDDLFVVYMEWCGDCGACAWEVVR